MRPGPPRHESRTGFCLTTGATSPLAVIGSPACTALPRYTAEVKTPLAASLLPKYPNANRAMSDVKDMVPCTAPAARTFAVEDMHDR